MRSLITINILEVLDTELETGVPANRTFCFYQLFIKLELPEERSQGIRLNDLPVAEKSIS